ncbi:MAG: Ycf51 family protein [Pseudanabaenaceae cyanobacterium]
MDLLAPATYSQLAQAMGLFVLAVTLLTGLAFAQKWGFRFRMVGITAFSVVLTVGLFALSLAPIVPTEVPGAAPYTVVFDRYGPEVAIAVPPNITATELAATLTQAGQNLAVPGRNGQGQTEMTVWARAIAHPQPGISEPVYVGTLRRSLQRGPDPNAVLVLKPEGLARLQALQAPPPNTQNSP